MELFLRIKNFVSSLNHIIQHFSLTPRLAFQKIPVKNSTILLCISLFFRSQTPLLYENNITNLFLAWVDENDEICMNKFKRKFVRHGLFEIKNYSTFLRSIKLWLSLHYLGQVHCFQIFPQNSSDGLGMRKFGGEY